MPDTGLYPVIEIPEFTEEEDTYDKQYKPSVTWDLEIGDFILDTNTKMVECDGIEAYKTWCIKTVATERYSCQAYDDDIGTEMEEAMKEEDNDAVELAISRTIEEAILVNPRTESVEDFEFKWSDSGDHVDVTFTVYAVDWESFELTITI